MYLKLSDKVPQTCVLGYLYLFFFFFTEVHWKHNHKKWKDILEKQAEPTVLRT